MWSNLDFFIIFTIPVLKEVKETLMYAFVPSEPGTTAFIYTHSQENLDLLILTSYFLNAAGERVNTPCCFMSSYNISLLVIIVYCFMFLYCCVL